MSARTIARIIFFLTFFGSLTINAGPEGFSALVATTVMILFFWGLLMFARWMFPTVHNVRVTEFKSFVDPK